MSADWAGRLMAVSGRNSEMEEEEFLRLVDQAAGACTLDLARALMKTFNDRPDHGTQEHVVGVMSTAPDDLVIKVMLEELPRLLVEAPEWAESLIGLEVDKHPDLLLAIATVMSQQVKGALLDLLCGPGFQDFYPKAAAILEKLAL